MARGCTTWLSMDSIRIRTAAGSRLGLSDSSFGVRARSLLRTCQLTTKLSRVMTIVLQRISRKPTRLKYKRQTTTRKSSRGGEPPPRNPITARQHPYFLSDSRVKSGLIGGASAFSIKCRTAIDNFNDFARVFCFVSDAMSQWLGWHRPPRSLARAFGRADRFAILGASRTFPITE